MIQFSCGCGKRLKATEEQAGRRARCPRCGKLQMIPQPSPAPFWSLPATLEAPGPVFAGAHTSGSPGTPPAAGFDASPGRLEVPPPLPQPPWMPRPTGAPEDTGRGAIGFRLARAGLLVGAGLLLGMSAFLPWASWNNLFGSTKAGGEWSIVGSHDRDARIMLSAGSATGGFDVQVTTYSEGRPVKRIGASSPKPSEGRPILFVLLAILLCVAAVPRSKLLVSIPAAIAAACGLYSLLSLRGFVSEANQLNEYMPIEASLEPGAYVLAAAALLALLGGVVVWLEPGRRQPAVTVSRIANVTGRA